LEQRGFGANIGSTETHTLEGIHRARPWTSY
jgi:hypothetical protein